MILFVLDCAVDLVALLLFGALIAVVSAIAAHAELMWNLLELLTLGGFSPEEIGICLLAEAWL